MSALVSLDPKRIAPTLLAGVIAAVYVITTPPSGDLATHMFRAALFRQEGFGIWNNWWYSGHHIVGYSVLYPAVSFVGIGAGKPELRQINCCPQGC